MQISDNGIVYANSEMVGMPVLSGTAGSLITVLDAVLPTAGFTKAFSGTNKAVYRADDALGTRLYLRIDDSTTTYATVVGYEAMSDVDTGTGAFNTNWYWRKSQTADGSSRSWVIVADSRAFYLFTYWHSSYLTSSEGYWFGDLKAYRSTGDSYHCGIIAATGTEHTYPGGNSSGQTEFYTLGTTKHAGHALARTYTQLGSAIGFWKVASPVNSFLGSATALVSPEPMNNSVMLYPVLVGENYTIRGAMPGLYSPHALTFTDKTVINDIPGLGSILFVKLGYGNGEDKGRAGINLTGPWR